MQLDKHYLQLHNEREEIPADALKDPAAFILYIANAIRRAEGELLNKYDLLEEAIKAAWDDTNYWRILLFEIFRKTESQAERDFCMLSGYFTYTCDSKFNTLKDKAGELNPRLYKLIFEDIQTRETTTSGHLLAILQEVGEGKDNYLYVSSKDFNSCREWLALPSSKQLVKICEEMGELLQNPEIPPPYRNDFILHFSDRIPPFFVLLAACMIQAYFNYSFIEHLEETSRKERKERAKQHAKLLDVLEVNYSNTEEVINAMELIKYTKEYDPDDPYTLLYTFTAGKIGEAIRPTKQRTSGDKHKPGETRNDTKAWQALEEIINALQAIMSIYEVPNTAPQGKATGRAWQVKPTYNTFLIEVDGSKYWNLTAFTDSDNYIFIDPDLMPGVWDGLATPSRAAAYYYIALIITEARRAGKQFVNINKSDLLYLCGYEDRNKRTKSDFIIKQVMPILERLENGGKIKDYYKDPKQLQIVIF